MKIINQFKKLHQGSKIALRFRKYPTEVFCGSDVMEYGIKIILGNGHPINKEYEKFSLYTDISNNDRAIIIKANLDNINELEVFAYLIEYVLFELGNKSKATPADIKKFIDDWLKFSTGKKLEITIEKQIGLIGELLIFQELSKEFLEKNQLNNWHGPEGSKIDFIFNDKFGLEVKSRIQPFKDWISISSVEQLDNELEGQHIVVCDFLPNDMGKTLKEFTDDVINKLNDNDKANELINKMRKANYDYFTNYSNLIKVSLFKQTVFDTKSSEFPVLKKVLNLRIAKIKYDININGLKNLDFTFSIAKIRSQLESN